MEHILTEKGGVSKMFDKILVPLDGSELAECALPYAANLAKDGLAQEVTLLTVFEIPSLVLSEGFDFVSIRNGQISTAKKYLATLLPKISTEGVTVRTEVLG